MRDIFKKSFIIAVFLFIFILSIDANAQDISVSNLSGSNRFATATSISKSGWPTGSENVILVNSTSVADSLSVAPLSSALNSPVLLTGSNVLEETYTRPELTRLNPTNIILIGGSFSISNELEASLKSEGYNVERISGKTRNETSLNIARKLKEKIGKDFDEVFIVNGMKGLVDAASIGAVAASKSSPIIFTDTNSSSVLINDLSEFSINKAYLIGGESSLDSGFNTLTVNVERISGKDRINTNISVIKKFFGAADTLYIADDGSKNPSRLIDAVLINSGIIASNNGGSSSIKLGPVMLMNSNYGFKFEQLEFFRDNSALINSLVQVSGGNSIKNSIYNIRALLGDSFLYGKQILDKLINFKNVEIVYTVEGKTYRLNGEKLLPIIGFNANESADLKFNENYLKNFLYSIKYTQTVMFSEGAYAYWSGNNVVLINSTKKSIDINKSFNKLLEVLKAGKSVSGLSPYFVIGKAPANAKLIGKNYILINIRNQNMKLFQNTKEILSTPVVTGNPNKGMATPPGIFKIKYKARNVVLRGPGYASPVRYWMPFNGSIGIHDAYWQPFFGGNRYLYAGSHGCVNTPLNNVAYIYGKVSAGTPVVVVRY